MADIAAIYHWSICDMGQMDLAELMRWHGRALEHWKQLIRLHGHKPL